MRDSSFGTIYIGAPIEHASERDFLAAVAKKLEEERKCFVVLANFHAKNRQIDCVVVTSASIDVVEVKSSHLPVRGEINGRWSRQSSSGIWLPYANAYLQALSAKNALRDAMRSYRMFEDFYPGGNVVFTLIFDASELTRGDFKVNVGTLDQFLEELAQRNGNPWSLDQWRDFAVWLGLSEVSFHDAIAPPQLRPVLDALNEYCAAFEAEYGPDGKRWLPESEAQRKELVLAMDTGAGCALIGPSGCGKTLMAKWLAVELSRTSFTVVFFSAKDFTGLWGNTIQGEVGLLTKEPPRTVLRAGRVGRPLVLVLDGINELGANRTIALRGIRALADRFDARLILTGQEAISELAGLQEIAVNRPSTELKARIAELGGRALSSAAREALRAASTGLEARIVGQLGIVAPDLPRVALLDQYMRVVLADHARAALVGLRLLAVWLHKSVAFSIAEVPFDDLMRSNGIAFTDIENLFSSGLLVSRSGRVSFSHEMFQRICTALAVAPRTIAEAGEIGRILAEAIWSPIAGDVIAAIDDSSVCRATLVESTDVGLLTMVASGEVGAIARAVVKRLLAEVAEKCKAEIRAAELVLLKSDGAVRVEWTDESHLSWTKAEQARLLAIGRCASMGSDPEAYMGLCSEMDARLSSERRRLQDEAKLEKFPLRSESFRLTYYGFGTYIGFTYVADAARPWVTNPVDPPATKYVSFAKKSPGQMLFLLDHRRLYLADMGDNHFAEELTWVVKERFRFEPYHLQLEILESAGFARDASETVRLKLIDAIQSIETSNLFISTSIVDALNMLGALDDEAEGAREGIRSEIAVALSAVPHDDRDRNSLSLCMRMIDHPFDWVYWEEIHALPAEDRHRLFRQAVQALEIDRSFGNTFIVGGLIAFEDKTDVPLIRPLTRFPDTTSSMPQEAWGAFVLATRFLGRYKGELLPLELETSEQICVSKIRTIVYAMEADSPGPTEEVSRAWAELHALPPQLVIGCLAETHSVLTERMWSESARTFSPLDLVDFYPENCLRIAREFVESGRDAQFFGHFSRPDRALPFAFGIIARLGDRSDIGMLRERSNAPVFAEHALKALRVLDVA